MEETIIIFHLNPYKSTCEYRCFYYVTFWKRQVYIRAWDNLFVVSYLIHITLGLHLAFWCH